MFEFSQVPGSSLGCGECRFDPLLCLLFSLSLVRGSNGMLLQAGVPLTDVGLGWGGACCALLAFFVCGWFFFLASLEKVKMAEQGDRTRPKLGSGWIHGLVAPLKTSDCIIKSVISQAASELVWKLRCSSTMCVQSGTRCLWCRYWRDHFEPFLSRILTDSGQQECSQPSECPVFTAFNWGLQSYRLF